MSLRIRLASPADAAGIAAIYEPICRHTAISFETEPPHADEMARRIAAVLVRLPWLVCVEGDAVLGYAYARPYHERAAYAWTLEVSVYVAEAARGKGIASALYTALFDLLAAQGYRSVLAVIALPNAASVNLHERFGFEQVGRFAAVGYKLGAWHDVGYWQRALRPVDQAPPALVPIGDLVGGSTWRAALEAGLARLAIRPARKPAD